MSMSVGTSTAAHLSRLALQQGNNERHEKVEYDHDADDKKSANRGPQVRSGADAQAGNKGRHINTFA